jgi:ABC-type phosphate transport system substrate-binding protein
MWGWIAGVAVLLLIGFLIIAGWNNNPNTASTGSSPTATTSGTAPSTTGSGSTSPKPMAPAAPMAPAPTTPPQGGAK